MYFDNKFSHLCKNLSDDKVIKTDEKIFNTLVDLAVFAAIIAIDKGRGRTVVEKNGSEIPERIFINQGKDGLVYMIALMETKEPYVLKDDKKCWRIFQEYVNTGMSEISGWLSDNPTDATGVDTLLGFITEKASVLLDSNSDYLEIPNIKF